MWTKVENRDWSKRYNPMNIEELNEMAPKINWAAYLETTQIPVDSRFLVSQISFYEGADNIIADTPLDTWKDYIGLQTISAFAPGIAYLAYKMSLDGTEAPASDVWTGDQRFFLGWAQVWRSKTRDEEIKRLLTVDPHSPPKFRANGAAVNVPAFYEAFDVKEGDGMYLAPEERVKIW